MSGSKRYFSERHGRGPNAEPMPFESVRRLVVSVFDSFRERDYMQEAFGYECVDAGFVPGSVGLDPDAYFLRTIRREGVWPYWAEPHRGEWYETAPAERWDEDTMYDVVEVMHDLISKPLNGRYHDYAHCGWHYNTFDQEEGQREYREEINAVLRLADPAYELGADGLLIERGPQEFRQLLGAEVPPDAEDDVAAKIAAATTRFQARGASLDDRRHAVRDLADVLEAIRQDMKDTMLSADESDLFNIANNFAIRHHNRKQRPGYDRATWLRWMFYVYLATIHAVLRVRDRD